MMRQGKKGDKNADECEQTSTVESPHAPPLFLSNGHGNTHSRKADCEDVNLVPATLSRPALNLQVEDTDLHTESPG